MKLAITRYPSIRVMYSSFAADFNAVDRNNNGNKRKDDNDNERCNNHDKVIDYDRG